MTDLEIIKRIAEIVGCPYDDSGLVLAYDNWINPLIDALRAKAWCFDLMVEYKVNVEPENCSAWIEADEGYPLVEVIHHEGSLQEAIYLAIIKYKELNHE